MLSRTADHLFWMSRYTERAENTARLLDVSYQTSLLPQSDQVAQLGWQGLLSISELLPSYEAIGFTDRVKYIASKDKLWCLRKCLLPSPPAPNYNNYRGYLNCGVDGVLDPAVPVDGIDQLFFQAIALSPILIAKVQEWAAVSDGYFCSAVTIHDAVRSCQNRDCQTACSNRRHGEDGNNGVEKELCPAGFVRWRDVAGKELQVQGQVRWAKIKSVQRSIEKSTRSYSKVYLSQLVAGL